ncbi:hypothetical protein G6F43_010115 [Rhizopus delemar]|nr:hypothetical protein G6F43_010115 [Rhizopus delemar]
MPNEEATHVGYADAPGGIEVREGLNYNPYFPGDAIATSRVLFDGDICTFLAWGTEPEYDDRKMSMKAVINLTGWITSSIWLKRFKWAPIKSRKIVYSPK